jgi:UDP-GlcNAc3NAcA epimerase
MKKIVTVLGARPQFIKASVVSKAIEESNCFEEVLVHTGQHFDANMSDVFFDELRMPKPRHYLGIHGGSHGAMTGRMLEQVEGVFESERPDVVLVYGDTNSTLAGALAAAKMHIPIAHVEAGLRSFNLRMPEEINRVLTDRVSRWLFTPTAAASAQLRREGVDNASIFEVGDVMYDAAILHGGRVGSAGGALSKLALRPGTYVLATVHRAENTDNIHRLLAIADGLQAVATQIPVVWPLHPRTRAVLGRFGRLSDLSTSVCLFDPVGYLDMVQLEKNAAVIATDSGGVQKEAFFHRVPCVTIRDETEWVELVESGWNQLAPPISSAVVSTAIKAAVGRVGRPVAPYGAGDAALKIVRALKD